MIQVGLDPALWVAVAAPVLVIGWSMIFAANSALNGPGWALRHLRLAVPALGAGVIAGTAAALLVSPSWLGVAIIYPFAVGAWLAVTRRRQLAFIERDSGFGEVDPQLRLRLLHGLGRSLRIAGAVAWFSGLGIVALGVAQGWSVTVLGPTAVLIARFLGRRTVVPSGGRPS